MKILTVMFWIGQAIALMFILPLLICKAIFDIFASITRSSKHGGW